MSWLLWALAAVLTTLSVGLLLHPLLRRRNRQEEAPEAQDASAYDISIYRDQLAEIDQDQARGVLTEAEAGAARLEVQRRLLAADRRREQAVGRPKPLPRRRVSAAASLLILILVPLATVGLYLWLGQPETTSVPIASRGAEFERLAEMRAMTDQLRVRLADSPDDPRGWELLARAESELGDWQGAAEAYREALSRSPSPSADLQSALGEAITAAGGGTVTPEAKTAFQRALEIDPQDPRARYYQGLWLQQAGQVREALDSWLELAASTPRDAGWRPLLRQQIVGAAEQLGLPIAELRIPEGTAPESDLPAAAAGVEDMSPEERQAFVRSMVEGLASRLEENPEDLDGWLRLVQARLVLGETEEALAALRRAEPLVQDLPPDDQRRAAVEEGLRLLGEGS